MTLQVVITVTAPALLSRECGLRLHNSGLLWVAASWRGRALHLVLRRYHGLDLLDDVRYLGQLRRIQVLAAALWSLRCLLRRLRCGLITIAILHEILDLLEGQLVALLLLLHHLLLNVLLLLLLHEYLLLTSLHIKIILLF